MEKYTPQVIAITRLTIKYMIAAKLKGAIDYDRIMKRGIFEIRDNYPAAFIKTISYNLN